MDQGNGCVHVHVTLRLREHATNEQQRNNSHTAMQTSTVGRGSVYDWFTTHSPRDDPTVRLFCFPHAGGGVHAYQQQLQPLLLGSRPVWLPRLPCCDPPACLTAWWSHAPQVWNPV